MSKVNKHCAILVLVLVSSFNFSLSAKNLCANLTVEKYLILLEETFLEKSKQLTSALAVTKAEANVKITEANKKIASLEKILNEQRQSNMIPIGFLYTQLPNETTPTLLWPSMTWSDVTLNYAGVFFRAEGGGSQAFGQTQPGNDHRVVRFETSHNDGDSLYENKTVQQFDMVGESQTQTGQWIWTGDDAKQINHSVHLRLVTSTGEIRPRNMAVRIWKRIG